MSYIEACNVAVESIKLLNCTTSPLQYRQCPIHIDYSPHLSLVKVAVTTHDVIYISSESRASSTILAILHTMENSRVMVVPMREAVRAIVARRLVTVIHAVSHAGKKQLKKKRREKLKEGGKETTVVENEEEEEATRRS